MTYNSNIRILDSTCGYRGIWFDKNNQETVYVDIRRDVKPDLCCDFKMLPFPAETFDLIIFDPPHGSVGEKSELFKRYGTLKAHKLVSTFYKATRELFRVLKTNGILIFKWNTHDYSLKRVLALFPVEPLFGQKTAYRKKHVSSTYWVTFVKMERLHNG